MILTAFADPPSLTAANPNPTEKTDWTEVPYFTTIQSADLLGLRAADQVSALGDGRAPGRTDGVVTHTPT